MDHRYTGTVTMNLYQGKNLRIDRVSKTERPYLISTVARARRPLFRVWHIGRLLVAELREAT